MRYTAVFKWTEGQEPRVGKGDGWKGGELCAVSFNDALDELQRLREAAQHYCDNYLRDEFDEPELCYDDRHRAAVVALWDALETTPNVELTGAGVRLNVGFGVLPEPTFERRGHGQT